MDTSFGFRIGSLFGIGVYIRPAWLLVLGLLIHVFASRIERMESYSQLNQGAVWIVAVATAFLLYIAVLCHELGHALSARRYGNHTDKISLHFFGAATHTERESLTPGEEFWVSLWGPLVSLAVAILLLLLGGLAGLLGAPPWVPDFFTLLGGMNLFLFVVNLAPGLPLDGGRILRAAVWQATGDYLKATQVAAIFGRGIGILMILAGVALLIAVQSLDGIFLGIMGYLLIRMASTSVAQAQLQTSFAAMTVRDMMRPVLAVIPHDASLREVADGFIAKLPSQPLHPVVSGEKLVGFLDVAAMTNVEVRQYDWVRAREIADPVDPKNVVAQNDDLFSVFRRMIMRSEAVLPVFDGTCLVGFVRRMDLLHYLNMRRAS